ncbi:MAG: flagellar basal body-associated protein FliL [Oxalicibacterium faecigallinarum]|uniref:Flagellar protein FliL n=1 Tax=Oxalicibacterium faecigallinarum TaxID=573741 RepID=A0A8J3ATL6_9BURK|nr:flagellar basal body-associated protein FliL [Oxalicibacterium faecigallinarum]MDQ7969937.1 flagellar basal body-associated protein FliL [Oxalicibacterium faecigallinarum]GGI16346.1 flagellar basal body-associated protein FliL [Oxalicibacterium faecigallinarum]
MATSGKGAPKKAEDSESKPKKSKLMLIILILVVVLGAGGAAAWYFLVFNKAPAEHQEAKAQAPKPPVFLPMDVFTVNLQSEEGERFLQTGLTLQLAGQEQVDLIKLYMPHVRSRLLLLLSSKKASDILSAEGKNKLAQEIIDSLGQPFSPGGPSVKVMSVLFTSFVVQ